MTRMIGFVLGLVLGVAMAVMTSGVDRAQLRAALTERLPESLRGLVSRETVLASAPAASVDHAASEPATVWADAPPAMEDDSPDPVSDPVAAPAAPMATGNAPEPAGATARGDELPELPGPEPNTGEPAAETAPEASVGGLPGLAEDESPLASTADPAADADALADFAPMSPVEQTIWRPFRSERSARGFAALLAERTNTELQVRRDAPGVYQVVVTAATDTELAAAVGRLEAAGGWVSQGAVR